MKLDKKTLIIAATTLVVGLGLGWVIFGGSSERAINQTEIAEHDHENETIWTCSMHPQIRMNKPGQCPICGMELIPLKQEMEELATNPDEIQMSEAAIKLAEIQTARVKKGIPERTVYLLGVVKPDERNISEITARFGGRIEELNINFTGQNVRKGENLATIYSPELISAQRELLEAIKYKDTNPGFYKAARTKLLLWDLTEEQIDGFEKSGETQHNFSIQSPISGTVTKREVSIGDYVKVGTPMFELIDLSMVWVMFDAYESDLPWIRTGDKIEFNIQSLPGRNYSGKVKYIDPLINEKTRIAKVRVELNNSKQELKPEMFANGILSSEIPNTSDLLIPNSSILWTGKRAVVYVKVPDRSNPTFVYREIVLGPQAGNFYVVESGLEEGEEIAVNGVFKIDAAAQLAGKPSMMNPDGGSGSVGSMPGMDMGGGQKKSGQAGKASENMDASKSDKPALNMQFRMQLTTMFNAYLPMKNDFVDSDSEKVSDAAEKMKEKLKDVNMELVNGDAHSEWMEYAGTMNKALDKIITSHDIEIQRQSFADLNLTLYKVLDRFGLANDTAYFQYCPMAFNDKGAYWFSEKKEIENPYFGQAMLKCGETRKTFNFKK